jgi:tetratricopeptide (TPR) repeat protein
LIAGMSVAVLLFARGRRPAPEPGTPDMSSTSAGVRGDSAAAAAAHRAAGVTDANDASRIFAERRSALAASLALEPNRRDLVLQMARLLHDGHRTRDAIPYYEKALEMGDGEAQAYYDLASAHAELGQWGQAADVLDRRLDQDGGDAVALYDLGAVRANQGRTMDARVLFERARSATSDGELLARISEALARLKGV